MKTKLVSIASFLLVEPLPGFFIFNVQLKHSHHLIFLQSYVRATHSNAVWIEC